MTWPGEAVQRTHPELDVEIVHNGQLMMDVGQDSHGHKTCYGVAPIEADVLVLQRPLNKVLAEAIPFVQANGTAVVVELDDDFMHVHRRNAAWKDVQPNRNPTHSWQHLKTAARNADHFVCTTPLLAQRYRQDASTVIENYLPPAYADLSINNELTDPPRLSWSGTLATHPTDVQVAQVLGRLIRDRELSFHHVGHPQGLAAALRIEENMIKHRPWVELEDYPREMSWGHIGMVPLDTIPFNQAKSWLKGLEFAGAGVPFVATPTAEYQKLSQREGIGRLAKRPRDWERQVRALMDPVVWKDEQQRQREIVLERFMIEDNSWRWADAWKEARQTYERNMD